jgi:hypothetical protein
MVGQGDQPIEKTAKEITREADEEIAQAARLAQEDGFGLLKVEARDGAPPRGHHPKFNQ